MKRSDEHLSVEHLKGHPQKNLMEMNLTEMSLTELWHLFPIVLEEHNPHYGAWYETERTSLSHILQDIGIFRINHIGSTSVANLIAKPIIDILLEIDKTTDRKPLADIIKSNCIKKQERNSYSQPSRSFPE